MPKQPYSDRSLFVENLPFRFTDEDLIKYFSEDASVKDARVYVQADGTSCGVGYVKFGMQSDALLVLERAKREGFVVDGRRLRLHPFTRELDEEYKRRRQEIVHREFRHPSQFEARPDTVLLYNLPEELRTEEQVLAFGHKAYKSFTFAKLGIVTLKDWRARAAPKEEVNDQNGNSRFSRYAVLHIAREKAKDGLNASDLSKVCADLFKRAKKEFNVTKESFIVRPYDIHAAPKATTLILRDLPFYVTYEELRAAFTEEMAPVLEYRIPGKSQGRSGAGFAFVVLADHGDCARLVQKAHVRVHGRDAVVDWSLAKDKFEERQAEPGGPNGGAANRRGEGATEASVDGSFGDQESRGGSDGSGGSEGSDGSDDSDAFDSSDSVPNRAHGGKKHGEDDLPFEIESYHSSMLAEEAEPSDDSQVAVEASRGSKQQGEISPEGVAEESADGAAKGSAEESAEASAYDSAYDSVENLEGDPDGDSDVEIREVVIPSPGTASRPTATAEDKEAEFNSTIFVTNLPTRLPKDRMSDSEAAIRASEEAKGAPKGVQIDPQRVLAAGLRYELRSLFRPFGSVKSINVLTNKGTGRPTGSAFVRFAREGSAAAVLGASEWLRRAAAERSSDGAEGRSRGQFRGGAALGLEIGEADIGADAQKAVETARAAVLDTLGATGATGATGTTGATGATGAPASASASAEVAPSPIIKYKLPETSYSLQEGAFLLNLSPIHVSRAVPAGDLRVLKQHRKAFGPEGADAEQQADGGERDKDPRNLRLASVGLLLPGTPAFAETDVPQGDVQRRVKCWARLKAALKDPNMHLNALRLSILNIPDEIDELRVAMLVGKSVGLANESEVRSEVEKAGLQLDGPEAARARCQVAMLLLRKNGVRDLRMARQGQRAKNLAFSLWDVMSPRQAQGAAGAPAIPPRHVGHAFVEFRTHEQALRCLLKLNNSARAFTRERRPIVQFATTNVGEMRRREENPRGKGAGQRLWSRGPSKSRGQQKRAGVRQKK